MITLSYGYLKPSNPDTGDAFFIAMEENIQRTNDHTHNGTDSAPLHASTVDVPPGSWVAAPIGGGVYRQAVTMPTGWSYDSANIWFKLSTGEYVLPTVERISTSQFYVYTNDNTKNYTAFVR